MTLFVQPLSRDAIDGWPIAESGLPVRVVNSTRHGGLRTIGELRSCPDSRLLELRSLGRISLGHIHFFFRLCDQIEKGTQRFQSIQDIFEIFLSPGERSVLVARYGLDQQRPKPSRNCATLQAIGNAQGRTRERIRQVEESAKSLLRSRLARVCLTPFRAYFGKRIAEYGGLASAADLLGLAGDVVFAGYNPAGVLLLLHDVDGDALAYRRGLFSILPTTRLEGIERAVLVVLSGTEGAIGVDDLTRGLRASGTLDDLDQPERLLATLLEHTPSIACTMDGRFFRFEQGTEPFLAEVLAKMERPAHYRAVTRSFNEQLKAGCHKGAGFILEALNQSPRCVRADRGLYDLA